MAKRKHSPEWMLARVNEYLSGMGSYESIAKARRKVNSARKIFSGDMRFPLTFFKYESPWNEDPEVRRLASAHGIDVRIRAHGHVRHAHSGTHGRSVPDEPRG